MPQLLLELFSEEIPARMQANAAGDLERLFRERLAEQGLLPEAVQAYGGPRRLTLVADGLPAAQKDRTEARRGPRTTAPEQALAGFLRSTGLAREQLTEEGGFYHATIATPGRPTPEIIGEIVPAILRAFPWPKSMRSGASAFRWVRPLKRILCTFDGEVVAFTEGGITSGDLTEGHRFHASRGAPVRVRRFEDYAAALEREHVVLDPEERKQRILAGARTLCFARGLELVDDPGLLDEVAGLVEWPTPVLGDMDPAFLDLPPEVIRTSMRAHQKYFAVRRPGEAGLAPHFITVANIEAPDGGRAIAAGNAKVLSARLSDARFFWDHDRAAGFDPWLEKLQAVTFHAKLGTLADRAARVEALARELAPLVGADPDLAGEAARLCKADLASAMVGEFPELQGIMGGYYARDLPLTPVILGPRSGPEDPANPRSPHPGGKVGEAGSSDLRSAPSEDDEGRGRRDQIADAIRDHYKPQGPSDAVPTAPVTVAVALADKLDTLVAFFAIDEKPTGSRDPYALRRAALGVIRIVLEGGYRLSGPGLDFIELVRSQVSLVVRDYAGNDSELIRTRDFYRDYDAKGPSSFPFSLPVGNVGLVTGPAISDADIPGWTRGWQTCEDLLAFFADRLKVLLREQGRRHDLVDAVFALGDDDLVRIVARVEALDGFLRTEDGANLLAGYRRAVNILRAEAKKGELPEGAWADHPAAAADERALAAALAGTTDALYPALKAEDFAAAMSALSRLRAPVDAFFDRVLVNDPDPEVRAARLRLLGEVRDAMNSVADFSLVGG